MVRLVPFDGQAASATLRVPGLAEWSAVTVPLRPYEIATLYLDLELGRKRVRDLDAYRHVWATVHKLNGPNSA